MNPLFKRVLALLVVLGPAYWLIMTEDGQRRSDAFMLQLFGHEVIDFNLAELDPGVTREDLTQSVFPEVPWQCGEQATKYGNRLCSAKLGAFNGIPSQYITLYFVSEQINALKLVYRERYHEQMVAQLRRLLGEPASGSGSLEQSSQPRPGEFIEWRTDYGMVVVKRELAAEEEPAMLWLARRSAPLASARAN